MAEVTGAPRERPLSPHLDVWRWHVTMLTSILHRLSGIGLYVGLLILVGWGAALAAGPETFAAYEAVLGSIPGKLVMLLLTLGAFYHLAKGTQHLIWDAGLGFRLSTANFVAVAAIAFALVASAVVWVLAAMTGAL